MVLCAIATATALADRATAQEPKTGLSRGEVERIVDEYLKRTRAIFPPPSGSTESTSDRLHVFGDLRVREEYSFEQPGRPDRNRLRLRLRLGATFSVSEELELGARLRTGDPDDPNSAHTTLGDGFDSLDVNLDRAFLAYRPQWAISSSLLIGKFNHSFTRNPVYGELLWDADVQPEGLLISYAPQRADGGFVRGFAAKVAAYSLLEQAGGTDAMLAAAELSSSLRISEDVSSQASIAYYHYGDTSPDGNTDLLGDNRGNLTVDTNGDGEVDSFQSHFGIAHAVVSVTHGGFGAPVTLGIDIIHNARAATNADTGWSLGLSAGRSERAGDVRGYYQWQVVERDAVFSPLVQDDFLLATNHRSHVFGMNYQWSSDVGVHLWGLVSASHSSTGGGGTDQDAWRLRLDFDVKF